MNRAAAATLVFGLLFQPVYAFDAEDASGLELMEAVHERHHQYPHVYEELALITVDRFDRKQTRLANRYSRVEADGRVQFMLLFDWPEEVQGVALMATYEPDGSIYQYFYLPALGERLLESTGGTRGSAFLGTDFSIADLTGESLDESVFVRRRDERVNGTLYHLVDVQDPGAKVGEAPVLRRHYIDSDTLFILRTDHYDEMGRLHKIQTRHDIVDLGGGSMQANMIRMENVKEDHQTLLRVERRVLSRDYVPAGMFTHDWLLRHYPPAEPDGDEEEGNEEARQAE